MTPTRRGTRKYKGFQRTGFAHPMKAMKTSNVPNGSKCFSGFKVKRPSNFGVGSPRRTAIHACAYSCNVKPTTSAGNTRIAHIARTPKVW